MWTEFLKFIYIFDLNLLSSGRLPGWPCRQGLGIPSTSWVSNLDMPKGTGCGLISRSKSAHTKIEDDNTFLFTQVLAKKVHAVQCRRRPSGGVPCEVALPWTGCSFENPFLDALGYWICSSRLRQIGLKKAAYPSRSFNFCC